MVKEILKEGRWIEKRHEVLEFEHKDGKDKGWWSFNADEKYRPSFDSEFAESQKESYNRCLADSDIVGPFKRVETTRYWKNAKAICECGATIGLWNQYEGASPCYKCGTWHNMFGQTLKDPKYWDEDY